jgi:short subunit dehydrogenase-like uncharacterized protein
VPSDLAAYLMVKHFRDLGYECVGKIHLGVSGASGKISSGTIHSGLEVLDLPMKEKVALFSQHYLCDKAEIESKAGSDTFLSWNDSLERWQGYHVMSGVNIRYVCRSASILKYGKSFSYSEGMSFRYFIQVFTIKFDIRRSCFLEWLGSGFL